MSETSLRLAPTVAHLSRPSVELAGSGVCLVRMYTYIPTYLLLLPLPPKGWVSRDSTPLPPPRSSRYYTIEQFGTVILHLIRSRSPANGNPPFRYPWWRFHSARAKCRHVIRRSTSCIKLSASRSSPHHPPLSFSHPDSTPPPPESQHNNLSPPPHSIPRTHHVLRRVQRHPEGPRPGPLLTTPQCRTRRGAGRGA